MTTIRELVPYLLGFVAVVVWLFYKGKSIIEESERE